MRRLLKGMAAVRLHAGPTGVQSGGGGTQGHQHTCYVVSVLTGPLLCYYLHTHVHATHIGDSVTSATTPHLPSLLHVGSHVCRHRCSLKCGRWNLVYYFCECNKPKVILGECIPQCTSCTLWRKNHTDLILKTVLHWCMKLKKAKQELSLWKRDIPPKATITENSPCSHLTEKVLCLCIFRIMRDDTWIVEDGSVWQPL